MAAKGEERVRPESPVYRFITGIDVSLQYIYYSLKKKLSVKTIVVGKYLMQEFSYLKTGCKFSLLCN